MSALAEHIAGVPLIDQHVHGCWLTAGDRSRFENALNEANIEPLADFDSGFDTQLGFAVRAHCAPLLGLPQHAEPQDYWQRRSQHTEAELARIFLRAAGVSDWLIDTGYAEGVADVAQVAELSADRAHEVVRLEQVAEQAADSPGDYASAFEQILRQRLKTAVGTKVHPGLPRRIRRRPDRAVGGRGRVSGRPMARPRRRPAHRSSTAAVRVCIRRCGWASHCNSTWVSATGNATCTRPIRCYLLDFLRQSGDTPIVLLHCYPYEREAGYLAQAFNNVYLDGGLSINHLGARSPAFIARLLELAPFRKIVYSSDGFGPAELHYLGTALWRNGIHRVLSGFVDDGDWSASDAMRVVDLIARGNAARIYRLGDA